MASEDLAITPAEARRPAPATVSRQRGWRWRSVAALLALLALAWEAAKLLGGIGDNKLPHVWSILAEFATPTRGGRGPIWLVPMATNAVVTFGEALAGFALGSLLGCGLALLFASYGLLERGCLPYVIGSQTVPILAIAPMVVVGLGRMGAPSWLAKAVVAAYLTFFPVTIGMLRGLRATPSDALDLLRSYAPNAHQIFWKLRLPVALPFLFTSLKVAATASVIGAIVAELPAGSQRGLGVALINATQYYNSNPPALYATVLVAALVGLLFYGLVALAERLVLGPRRSDS